MLSVDLNLVLSNPPAEQVLAVAIGQRSLGVQKGGKRYLGECDVVLDVGCFLFGFGVVPGDILNRVAVDGGVIVSGGSEGEGCGQLIRWRWDQTRRTPSMDKQCCASKRRESETST